MQKNHILKVLVLDSPSPRTTHSRHRQHADHYRGGGCSQQKIQQSLTNHRILESDPVSGQLKPEFNDIKETIFINNQRILKYKQSKIVKWTGKTLPYFHNKHNSIFFTIKENKETFFYHKLKYKKEFRNSKRNQFLNEKICKNYKNQYANKLCGKLYVISPKLFKIINHVYTYAKCYMYKNVYIFFRKMKRSIENEPEGEKVNSIKKTPTMQAILQQAISNVLTQQMSSRRNSPTGTEIQEAKSPMTPIAPMKPKKLELLYPQSAFWLKQLGKKSNENNQNEEGKVDNKGKQDNTGRNSSKMREIRIEDWDKMEAGLSVNNENIAKFILEIIKKIGKERKENSSNLDPISNKTIKPAGRRAFFLKEWEEHMHKKMIYYTSTELGLPYIGECKQLKKIKDTEEGLEIQINLNLESEMEDKLFRIYISCNNDIEKNKVYETMFLHFALSFNCLRPQTGNKDTKEYANKFHSTTSKTQNLKNEDKICKKIKNTKKI